MNLLIINASPRRLGNIDTMLEKARETALEQDVNVTYIRLYDKDVRPCIGCMSCRHNRPCPISDDAPEIGSLIQAADRIIIGAPCYWASMPGLLKNLFDRLVYIFIDTSGSKFPRPLLKGKKALIITTATTPMPFARLLGQTSGVVRSVGRILKSSSIRMLPSIQIGGTRNHSVGTKALRKVENRVKRLVKH